MRLLKTWFAREPTRLVLLPLVLGLLVRVIAISSRPLWYDEAFAVLFAEKGPAAMLVGTLTPTGLGSADVHPLGYYTILWLWMRVFGESLVSVRGLSILAGLGTIRIWYGLAHELFDQRTALTATTLLALAPFHVHYSQEIRMYAFLGFWLAAASYSFWRGSQSGAWRWWVAFAVSAAAAQYTHNLAAFHLLALAMWPVLTRQWRLARTVMIWGFVAVVLYLPWIVHLPAQFAKVDQAYWVDRPEAYRIFTLLLAYVTNVPLKNELLGPGLFISLSLVGLAVYTTLRARVEPPEPAFRGRWLLYLAFMTPALMFVFSQWKPLYLERALLPSGAAFMVWMGWILARQELRPVVRGAMITLLSVGFALGLYQHLCYSGFPYAPFKGLAARMRQSFARGDAIVHSSKLSMLPVVYYDRSLPQHYVADPHGSSVDTLAPSTQKVLGLEASDDIQSAVGDARRVWFIIFAESDQEYQRAGQPSHPHLVWLDASFQRAEVQHWNSLDVYLFIRNPE